ncbi:hypothetical protein EVAR_66614_1 [Eumeta japonica]|uniref:Uncharacterized protein n=1 Tax=Eumeta variegata TaxID=151549 RepID=A0A4C2AA32_EUMVA|nr:hypothetical protein EVAR_66614_1 [Eumeta japonica]
MFPSELRSGRRSVGSLTTYTPDLKATFRSGSRMVTERNKHQRHFAVETEALTYSAPVRRAAIEITGDVDKYRAVFERAPAACGATHGPPPTERGACGRRGGPTPRNYMRSAGTRARGRRPGRLVPRRFNHARPESAAGFDSYAGAATRAPDDGRAAEIISAVLSGQIAFTGRIMNGTPRTAGGRCARAGPAHRQANRHYYFDNRDVRRDVCRASLAPSPESAAGLSGIPAFGSIDLPRARCLSLSSFLSQ